MKPQNKFLLNLLSGLTHKQVFFLVWFGIAAIFALLMYGHYRRQTRRNFRRPEDGPIPRPRVDARRLGGSEKGEIVAKKGASPTRKV